MAIDSSVLKARLETAKTTFRSLEMQLADPDVASNPKKLESIARERARLEPLVLDYQRLQNIEQEYIEAKDLLRQSKEDKEMETLAQEEIYKLEILKKNLVNQIIN